MTNNILANTSESDDVMRLADTDMHTLTGLLEIYGLTLRVIKADGDIPGSYWGEEEAGLIANVLLVRHDTPLHSILHEACHYVCMDAARRQGLHTDAGGDYDEENAVCYLQILLAEKIPGLGMQRIFVDMDRWGYSFRLGSAQAWFEHDADDARNWLHRHELIDTNHQPSGKLRGD